MIKYYKNYRRGDRDINTKINTDKGDDAAMDEDLENKPSVIPVLDDIDDINEIADENDPMHGRFHTEGHDNDVNPGSFVQSEEEDGVEALQEEQNDTATNLPSCFANAIERPRALTTHDNNVQSKAPGKKAPGNQAKNTITPRANPYNSNPAKQNRNMAKQRQIGSHHSASY